MREIHTLHTDLLPPRTILAKVLQEQTSEMRGGPREAWKIKEIDSYMCVYVSSHLLSACSGLSIVNTENNFKLACRYRV